MAERQGAIVKTGHEAAFKYMVSILEEYCLPGGLLPLANVTEVGFVRETGYMWINQEKKIDHEFKKIGKYVSYACEVIGCLEKGKINKLEGVKAKELMIWVPINEIKVDDPPSGKIHFRALAGITKTFPLEAFALGE